MSDIIPNVVVSMPSQLFTLRRKFAAVSNGKVYIGKIDMDPTLPENQIQVYLENEDGSHVPVAQPIIINQAGYPVYNGQIAKFVTVEGHSMAVYDSYGVQQFYFRNILKYDPDQLRQELLSYGDKIVSSSHGGTVYSDYDLSEFIKYAEFLSEEPTTVTLQRQAVKHSDNMWYIWTGALPHKISERSPADDKKWRCVGLLNGFPVRDAQNFGFTDGMEEASPIIIAMMESPFFNMTFPSGSTINIAQTWNLRSDLSINFQGSVIYWKGEQMEILDKSKSATMCIFDTEDYGGGTTGSSRNIHLSNLIINANEYAIGIAMRNVTRFSLINIEINNTQKTGIDISNSHFGDIKNIALTNCAPLTSKGFTSDSIEEHRGDGIIIWYGSTHVAVDNIKVQNADKLRSGRCGIVVDGYAPPNQPDTRIISINNAYAFGYDRPVHTELCGVVIISNSVFEYSSNYDNHKKFKCVAIVWNTLEVTEFINCVFRSDFNFLKPSGGKAIFNGCNITLSHEGEFFTAGNAAGFGGKIEFNNCTLSQRSGNGGMYGADFTFNHCILNSDNDDKKPSVFTIGSESNVHAVRFNKVSFNNIVLIAPWIKRYSSIEISECSFIGSISADGNNVENVPRGVLKLLNNDMNGGVDFSGETLRICGTVPRLNIKPSSYDVSINGDWAFGRVPKGGRPDNGLDWRAGDRVITLSPVAGGDIGWICVESGNPGKWLSIGKL
ncbi:phage head-binding domain-containing protein [Arsenophonus nasoniae]|uniref:Head binding protein n=3 Tax=Arsenophonus nasoniae TaxID=638 RepID=A0A4P7L2R8_9GAMM|nr:phage head-binding domain-containing protein [Arsenophonus nasoniae]QBY44404.1 Head binding protein [Arsenophonus nasoniae]WGM04663.1 phage head-binding domain-containing protein [Arsenophonus nasoniae]WGM09777.1 phage head-binding domain-containing protein [Arsenophonus nasoniae]WGM14496.1 phage head-binding domain-containing protein [Arsenophonus nasoniae]